MSEARYWEVDLSQGNHFSEEDLIIGSLLSYIAAQAYEADRFGWFLKGTKPYCKFNLDTRLPEILEHTLTES